MYAYVEDIIDAKEFNRLCKALGIEEQDEKMVKLALENTIFSISAYDQGEIVGFGRIVGDETRVLYIQDLMVHPDYQGQNIGTTIMKMLIEEIGKYREINKNIVVSVSALFNQERFFKKFGFKTRSEVHLGETLIYKPKTSNSNIMNWEEGIVSDELEDVVNTLNNGGIVIYPTDTVYGIGCDCFNEKAVSKLFEIKERASYKPINVLADSYEKIQKVAKNITPLEKKLIDDYMPGALTVILEKKENVPDILTSGLPTIGVRIPENEIALEILKRVNYPLATTSANKSGNKDGVKIEDFLNEFDGKVDYIIDGGPTKLQQSSTIVEVENEQIIVVRQGSQIINE